MICAAIGREVGDAVASIERRAERCPGYGQSLARPDDSFSNVACHMNSPVVFAERHQHAAIAGLLRIAHRLVVGADQHDAVGDRRIAVRLRAELGDPLHVLPGLDVPRRRQALHRDTMLRLGVPPHIGQSADTADDAARTTYTHSE